MVVNGLEGGDCKQKRGLANRHAGQPLGDGSAARIEDETLHGMVVKRAVRIRHI